MAHAAGFWSYVHADNDAVGGRIHQLADDVQQEFGLLTGGEELDLFLDSAAMRWGDEWPSEIEKAVRAATFFIPIVTPRYFRSQACKAELEAFAEGAAKEGRDQLIMPIYFVPVPELEDSEPHEDDYLTRIGRRHWADWRGLRLVDRRSQPYASAVHRLAGRLVEVQQVTGTESRVPKSTETTAEEMDDAEDDRGEPHPRRTDSAPLAHPGPNGDESATGLESEGMLERLVKGEEAMPLVVQALEGISEQVQLFGTLIEEATSELEESDRRGKGFAGRLAVANRLARKLDAPSREAERLATEYSAHLMALDPAMLEMIRAAKRSGDVDEGDAAEFERSIKELVASSREAGEHIATFATLLEENQNLSRELAGPIRTMRAAVQALLDGQVVIENWYEEIEAGRTRAK